MILTETYRPYPWPGGVWGGTVQVAAGGGVRRCVCAVVRGWWTVRSENLTHRRAGRYGVTLVRDPLGREFARVGEQGRQLTQADLDGIYWRQRA